MQRRAATPQEAKALAHPLRLRILRLCLDEALTNKQLADRLDKDPATVLHHVRTLVNTGFLAVEGVRTGAKGALEKPYRSTGKSWRLDVGGAGDATTGFLAVVDAFRDEVLEAGPKAVLGQYRAAMRLSPKSRKELVRRLDEIADEFGLRDEPGGEALALFVGLHRRRVVSESGSKAGGGRGSGSGGRSARASRD